MDSTRSEQRQQDARGNQDEQGGGQMRRMYLRFAGMIVAAMVVMYGVMYEATYRWSHVTFSESRLFMAFAMGGAMGLIMIAWMLNMYKSAKANLAVVLASLLLFGVGVFLDRSQITVQGTAWMNSMIPHHSMAITRSERAEIDDVRVCQLAVDIVEAQKREILEMQWYIDDIEENGPARTPQEAAKRQVPDFQVAAQRECASE